LVGWVGTLRYHDMASMTAHNEILLRWCLDVPAALELIGLCTASDEMH